MIAFWVLIKRNERIPFFQRVDSTDLDHDLHWLTLKRKLCKFNRSCFTKIYIDLKKELLIQFNYYDYFKCELSKINFFLYNND